MTRPDPRDIPTLDDLVFPSDPSQAPSQPSADPSLPDISPLDRTPDLFSEQVTQNEIMPDEERFEPHFLPYEESTSDAENTFAAESLPPLFHIDEPELQAPASVSPNQSERQDPIFQASDSAGRPLMAYPNEPRFESIVRIHSLATEEADTSFVTSVLAVSSQSPAALASSQTEASPTFEGLSAAHVGFDELSSALAYPLNDSEPTSRPAEEPEANSQSLEKKAESIEARVEAVVRRVLDAELSQLTQRLTAEVLQELGKARS